MEMNQNEGKPYLQSIESGVSEEFSLLYINCWELTKQAYYYKLPNFLFFAIMLPISKALNFLVCWQHCLQIFPIFFNFLHMLSSLF